MENKSMALEVGQRCRRFRNALGISQQKLADMVGTTPQNISKYEKEGIHDIDIIRYLSNTLGHNLMTDEVEEEGIVGEIGKEILDMLVNNDVHAGFLKASEVLNGSSLYGLPENRIIKEVFKLEKIGLCVREQYIDFYDEENDIIFITAKGVITLKHLGAFKNQMADYANVKTYEVMCQGYDSYQAYINSEPIEKIIKNLSVKNGFRANYIQYIQKQYGSPVGCLNYEKKYFPGNSAYTDIMFSMIMDITREKADYIIALFNENYSLDLFERFHELSIQLYNEIPYRKLIVELKKFINDDLVNENINSEDWIEEKKQKNEDMNGEQTDKYNELMDMLKADEQLSDVIENAESHLTETFMEKLSSHSYTNPLNWFSKEEIELYIEENILEADSDYERDIERKLLEIKEKSSETIEGYFEFPEEWENNGLATLVRKIYKVE